MRRAFRFRGGVRNPRASRASRPESLLYRPRRYSAARRRRGRPRSAGYPDRRLPRVDAAGLGLNMKGFHASRAVSARASSKASYCSGVISPPYSLRNSSVADGSTTLWRRYSSAVSMNWSRISPSGGLIPWAPTSTSFENSAGSLGGPFRRRSSRQRKNRSPRRERASVCADTSRRDTRGRGRTRSTRRARYAQNPGCWGTTSVRLRAIVSCQETVPGQPSSSCRISRGGPLPRLFARRGWRPRRLRFHRSNPVQS